MQSTSPINILVSLFTFRPEAVILSPELTDEIRTCNEGMRRLSRLMGQQPVILSKARRAQRRRVTVSAAKLTAELASAKKTVEPPAPVVATDPMAYEGRWTPTGMMLEAERKGRYRRIADDATAIGTANPKLVDSMLAWMFVHMEHKTTRTVRSLMKVEATALHEMLRNGAAALLKHGDVETRNFVREEMQSAKKPSVVAAEEVTKEVAPVSHNPVKGKLTKALNRRPPGARKAYAAVMTLSGRLVSEASALRAYADVKVAELLSVADAAREANVNDTAMQSRIRYGGEVAMENTPPEVSHWLGLYAHPSL